MSAPKQAGFTLVELILVMAISSGLAVIAFIGQRDLQSRARFDAAINKIVQNIAYTRNYASTNVKETGAPLLATDVVLAGAAFEISNNHAPAHPLTELETIYGRYSNGTITGLDNQPWSNAAGGYILPDVSGSGEHEAVEDYFSLPVANDYITIKEVTFDSTLYPGTSGVVLNYINTGTNIKNCIALDPTTLQQAYDPASQSCSTTFSAQDHVDIVLHDLDGHEATIHVDAHSGAANRIN